MIGRWRRTGRAAAIASLWLLGGASCDRGAPRAAPDAGVDAGAPGASAPGAAPRAVEIAVGWAHSCARMSDDSLWCWGGNQYGELGAGAQAMMMPARPTPIQVVDLTGIAEIALGANHSCARMKDGTVRCWGSNENGQLGDGTNVDHDAPSPVPGLGGVRRIALGRAETCAVMEDGTVRCWGGQVGKFKPLSPQGGPIVDSGTPVAVQGLSDIVAVSLGGAHACALGRDGAVACWGRNAKGQIGDGTTETRAVPTRVPGVNDDVIDIAATMSSSCALRRGGSVVCWGGSGGEGGVAREMPGVAGAAQIAGSCARGAEGWVRCWHLDRIEPVDTVGAVQIAFGVAHGCLRTAAGEVRCWGANRSGELGDGTRLDRRRPVLVAW